MRESGSRLGQPFALLTNNVVPPRVYTQLASSIRPEKIHWNPQLTLHKSNKWEAIIEFFLAQKWNNTKPWTCKSASS